MSEEEKKAIERVKRLLSFNLSNPFLDHEADDIVILLNLIEKQNNRLEQDERVIEEMGEYIFQNGDISNICNKRSSDDCYVDIYDDKGCKDCTIDHFRKKCE